MSISVSSCLVCKAALGNKVAFENLVKIMKINLKCGHWTQLPCKCNPPCEEPTKEQLADLSKRVLNEFHNG